MGWVGEVEVWGLVFFGGWLVVFLDYKDSFGTYMYPYIYIHVSVTSSAQG